MIIYPELFAFLAFITIQVSHCHLPTWSQIGCKSEEFFSRILSVHEIYLFIYFFTKTSVNKLSNHVHLLLPGSSGCSWPDLTRNGRSLAVSAASAPHPRAPPPYSCGAVAAAVAPLKSGRHIYTNYIHWKPHSNAWAHTHTHTYIQ